MSRKIFLSLLLLLSPLAQADPERLRQMLHSMPKCELHTHLEGCVRPQTILELAEEYRVSLPANNEEALKRVIEMKPGQTLTDFLKKFDCFRFVFDHPQSLRRIAYEAIAENAEENVLYTELRINPVKHPDLLPVEGVLDAVLEGMQDACRDYDVEAGLIVSLNRSYSMESAMAVARAAAARKDRGVIGMDLAGDEARFQAKSFQPIFDYAREQGLHITIHAGEAAGPESIQQALDFCHAERIGHGVRLGEDAACLKTIRERRIPLEMCPNSNRLISLVGTLGEHPLPRYLRQGIPVSVSTDDRHIFDLTLTGEYVDLVEQAGVTPLELREMVLGAARASFLPKERKERLLRRLGEAMQRFESEWGEDLKTP